MGREASDFKVRETDTSEKALQPPSLPAFNTNTSTVELPLFSLFLSSILQWLLNGSLNYMMESVGL